MGQKIIASAAGVLLVSLAAVGTFASQDPVNLQEETPTATATEEATSTPEATETAEPTATPTEELEATSTPEGDEDDGDDDDDGDEEKREGPRGIPDSNPVFEEDDDGECEKHESAIKTTPSGNEVMVPCHAANKDHGNKHQADDDSDDEDADDDEEQD